MIQLLYNALYVFFVVLEMILFLYVIISWFPVNNYFKNFITFLIDPILTPVRFLLRHSIFNTPTADLSPIISFILILFFQEFFYALK
ncbi:MAG: YggT family protein [Lachnoclostridium sp.]|jgi:YggT family protein